MTHTATRTRAPTNPPTTQHNDKLAPIQPSGMRASSKEKYIMQHIHPFGNTPYVSIAVVVAGVALVVVFVTDVSVAVVVAT
jgi:hypothetical protein